MRVDTAAVLRILAHELRSPAGVALGYMKMVLDGRLPNPADHRRALEQTRVAIERMSALGREASEVASWLERRAAPARRVTLRAVFDAALEHHDGFDVALANLDDGASLTTGDEPALTKAVASMMTAIAREAPSTRLTLTAGPSHHPKHLLDIAVGPPHVIPELLLGPSAATAGPPPLERGGLGLSLVMALLVLDSHGVAVWTINDQRAALGLRFTMDTGHDS